MEFPRGGCARPRFAPAAWHLDRLRDVDKDVSGRDNNNYLHIRQVVESIFCPMVIRNHPGDCAPADELAAAASQANAIM
jgi:hypothetical protein